jgi:hypothetical protein
MAGIPFTMFTTTGDGWAWGVNGVVWSDGYATRETAEQAAREELSPEPEWCDRCGDQAVCPDCVGT